VTASDSRVEAAFAILDEARLAGHRQTFALFSGGHDSLTATKLAMEWAESRKVWLPVAHVNTGTGIRETHDFVVETAQEHGWPLIELHPPRSYESLVMEMGFPGPGFHDRLAYPRLKERCFRNLMRLGAGEPVMFITGVRSEESERRTEHVERIQHRDKIVWAAPIWDWSKIDCNHFLADRGLRRNPVCDTLHMSAECLCGTMAKKGELAEIERWYPEKAAEIKALEDRVEAAGLRACRWGRRPPNVAREQQKMFLLPSSGVPMLCMNCSPGDEEAA
jgi:3'-phosphoadenosine 5'-phosphosulfate sulfotransferase (PAPS reductase)/FAD synthetase